MKRFLIVCLVLSMTAAFVFAGGQSQGGSQGAAASITVEVFDRGTDGGRSDPTNNNWTNWIKEKLLKDENINVTFVAVPRSQEEPAIINMMAAGDAPDLTICYNANLINQFAQQGGLFDMYPYIDKNMPDLKKFLGPDPTLVGRDLIYRLRDSNTGKLYAVPARRVVLAQSGTFIRKDWLDKLGLPIPATTQQFYDSMVAFRDKDPAGLGSKTIPFAMRGIGMIDLMYGAFQDTNLSDKDRWIEGDVMQSGYKEMVRWVNKMYNEGLIDQDFPLYSDFGEYAFNLLKSGVAGCYSADWDHAFRDSPGILTDLKKNFPNAEIIAINPFTNSAGRTPKTVYDPVGVYSFVPIFSKAPEAAMRYLNWVSRFENQNFIQVGPAGVVHDMVNGIPQLKAATGPWIQNSPQNIDYTLHVNGLELGNQALNYRAITSSYNAAYASLVETALDCSTKDGKPFPVVPVTLTVTQYNATLTTKLDTLRVNAASCPVAQFDRVWEEGIRDYLASGYQAVMDERRAKYVAP